jgi:MYXO-CTERM domain-containing protein
MSRALVVITLLLCVNAAPAVAGTYYVATTGSDTSGDGSAAKPWATIKHAAKTIPDDGSTILVKDGSYKGQVLLSRSFSKPVMIRAEHRYRARLTNPGGEALSCYLKGKGNFSISGFEITNGAGYACSTRQNYLIHFENVRGIALTDCIIHDNAAAGSCNELLKLNSGSGEALRDVQISGNVFYNPAPIGGADIIDAKAIGDVDIHDNIFFATVKQTKSTSYVMIKDEKQQLPAGVTARNPRFRVNRNVFLSWQGAVDQAFVLFGEDGKPYHEVTNSLIENNLLIGNSSTKITAAFQLKGVKGVTIRANTIVGDLPGSSYALRSGTEGSNPSVEGVAFYNNIWSDFTGTMTTRFINTYGNAKLATFSLDNNLYYNGGTALSAAYFTSGSLKPSDDKHAIFGDPKTGQGHGAIVLPLWEAGKGAFKSGNKTIREEFVRLVQAYGAIGAGSAAIDKARGDQMPADDILGRKRDGKPDVGAFERLPAVTPDAGVAVDGGGTADGGPAGDAAVAGDGGGAGDGGATQRPSDDGCSCRLDAAPPPAGAALVALFIALLLVIRRGSTG